MPVSELPNQPLRSKTSGIWGQTIKNMIKNYTIASDVKTARYGGEKVELGYN